MYYCPFVCLQAAKNSQSQRAATVRERSPVCGVPQCGAANPSQCHLVFPSRRLSTEFRDFISPSSFQDLIESFEICPRLSICAETRCFERRNLFRHRGSNKLIDAGSIFTAQAINGFFERTRQPQWVCPDFLR